MNGRLSGGSAKLPFLVLGNYIFWENPSLIINQFTFITTTTPNNYQKQQHLPTIHILGHSLVGEVTFAVR